jgi:hypothetical protein
MQQTDAMTSSNRTLRAGRRLHVGGFFGAACLGLGLLAGAARGETVSFTGSSSFLTGSSSTDPSTETGNESTPATVRRQAHQRLNQLRLSHWSALEDDGAYQSAKDKLLAARRQLEAARQAVLADVYHSQDYQKLRIAVSEREQAFAALRDQPNADQARIYEEACQLLKLRAALTQVVTQACEGKQDIDAAKADLTDAYATIVQLRHQYAASLQNDPTWLDARTKLDEARKNTYRISASVRSVAARSGSSSLPVGIIGSRQLSLHQ